MIALGIRSALVYAGALVGVLSSASFATDTSNVAYQWKKGTKIYYRWTEMLDQAMSAGPGMDSKTQNGRVSTVTWDVKEVTPEGVAKITMTYNGFAVVSQLQRVPEPMKWDSLAPASSDATSPLAMIFSHVVGQSINFTVDARGNVSKVEGMEDLAKKLRQAAVDTPGAGTFVNGIQVGYTADQMKANIERVLSGNPEKAVKADDTWTDSVNIPYPQFGSFKLERTHKLESLDATKAKIGVAIKVTLNEPKEGDPAKAMFAMMSPKVNDGKGSATRTINLEKGYPEESKLSMNVPIEMTMSAQNMTVKNNLTTTIVLERLEQLPPGAVIPGETPPLTPPTPPKATPPSGDAVNLTPNSKK